MGKVEPFSDDTLNDMVENFNHALSSALNAAAPVKV